MSTESLNQENVQDDVAVEAEIATEPSLETQLADALAALAKAQADVLYAKAEAENVRRRAFDEADKTRKFAVEKFATEMLPVKDSLEMALKDSSGIENLKAGVELTLKQLSSAFDKANLAEINPIGDKLDPHRHQAMTAVPVEGTEPNTVIDVMQKGYTLADRVIRPALVVVSKAAD